jgi:methyl-accepting chemotaxis protein
MNATQEIASIIKITQDRTAKAVEKSSATETILNSQNEAVTSTTRIFNGIMQSMENLSAQVEQIMLRIAEMEENKEHAINAIQSISAVSEETAASSQEVTASTQEQLASIEELSSQAAGLSAASKELEQSISRFKLV